MIQEKIQEGLNTSRPLVELIADCNERLRICPFGHEVALAVRCQARREIAGIAKQTAQAIEKELTA